jgi:hypothetical protein
MIASINLIKKNFSKLKRHLDEKSRRLWCATEALAIGKNGVMIVHLATQVSRPTIYAGIRELQKKNLVQKTQAKPTKSDTRVRKKVVMQNLFQTKYQKYWPH